MDKYRRPDQEYFDSYDRRTIKRLKELEIQEAEKLAAIPEEKRHAQKVVMTILGTSFHDTAVLENRRRSEAVHRLMAEDDKKDRLVASTPAPLAPRCETCQQRTISAGHVLKEPDYQLIFLFDCPDGHAPRRALYPDGREYVRQKTVCEKCGSDKVVSTTEKSLDKIVFTDTCNACGHTDILELDNPPELPIDEADRKRYCTDYMGKQTEQEGLQRLFDLFAEIKASSKEKEVKDMLELDKIERLNIHPLQQRIIEHGEANGFVSLQLDKPEIIKDLLTVGFTLQDSFARKEKKSVEQFKQFIGELLLPTNWRIYKNSIQYRLGFLTGKLVGYEREIDLIKVAEEIIEKRDKKDTKK